ncbi:MAG TPA: alpha/beta hydrolase [Burkholderiales bacterium]|jgi:pimeloyl-ACP methyl ester carboxylesterase
MIASNSEFHSLRGLNCHLRSWGDPQGKPLLLLHGWMDNSASFQFFADAFLGDAANAGWRLVAPDWRGFGLSEWATGGTYAYTDYLADLDALVGKLNPQAPLSILGHSMGGYLACMYAAARPARVARLINLEGMGLRAREGAEAPAHLAQWLDELQAPRRPKTFASFDELAARIVRNNPALPLERALFVARHWATQLTAGVVALMSDPGHDGAAADLFRLDEAKAVWGAITCPVLWVEAGLSRNTERHRISPEGLAERRASLATAQLARIEGAGHMAHMEQPEALALLAADFLRPAREGQSAIS